MKERPILFSGSMVRALLDGTKTQTRRVVKPQPYESEFVPGLFHVSYRQKEMVKRNSFKIDPETREKITTESVTKKGSLIMASVNIGWFKANCPYGQPGDRLWVKETHWVNRAWDDIRYKATDPEWPYGWTPSIHMFRQASRITLEITAVRVERLQDISEDDAKAEGTELLHEYLPHKVGFNYRQSYGGLWESINGRGSWDANPWVWVVEFKRVGQ